MAAINPVLVHHIMHKFSMLKFAVSICGILSLVYCGRKQSVLPPPVVLVTKVITKEIPVVSEWVGTTSGLVNATIRPQVQGYLISQNYKDGSYVKKGELLFEIDPRPYEAALRQATAELAQSQAQYFANLTNLERVRPLAQNNALSMQTLDNAIGSEKSSMSAVNAAEAAVINAKINLSFTKIRSPVDGVAGIHQVEIGDLVGPSQAIILTNISIVDSIRVKYSVSEQTYIEQVRQMAADSSDIINRNRMIYELILADHSVYPYKGTFYSVNNQIDTATGTIKQEAIFPNPQRILKPGQFARLRVTTAVNKNALLIPQRALNQIQGNYLVAVVTEQNRIDLRNVQVGVRVGSLWEIARGLKPNETVVVEGIMKVKPGMEITPKPFVPDTSSQQSASSDASESGT